MFSTANTFKLILPNNEEIVFGMDKTDPNWVGLVGSGGVTSSLDLRESRSNLARGDGEIIGLSFWGSRSIVADIFIVDADPTSRTDKIEKLQKVTTMLRSPGLLTWTEQDTNQTEKQIPVRLQSFPSLNHNDGVTKNYQIALTATQPQIEQAGLASTFNNGAEDIVHELENEGDWDTYPVWVIDGPFGSFQLTNQTTNETIEVVFDPADDDFITSSQWVEIYSKPDTRQVLLKSSTTSENAYSKVLIGSNFPKLKPGINEIILEADNPAATVSAQWRNAWL